MTYQYDLLVIGSGSAGFAAASAAKGTGRKIGIVEKESRWGGECPNWACVPTKVLLKSAREFRGLQHLDELGVHVSGSSLDFGEVMRRRSKIVNSLAGERIEDIADKMGFDKLKGSAVFLDKHTIQVGNEQYTSEKFIITTGARTFVPPIAGLDKASWISFRDAVESEQAPKSLIIIGGGPVGCEFATFFATVGAQVTLLQGGERVLNREEPEISNIALQSLNDLGVAVHTAVEVLGVEDNDSKTEVRVRIGKEIITLNADKLLLATGKTSNTVGLGAGAAGIDLDHRGTIVVDEHMRTSADNIWAAGDVSGGMRFTHTAHYEGSIAGLNAFAGKDLMKVEESVVPRVTFVDPEVASVGMTEAEARKNIDEVLVGTFNMRGLGRAFIDNEKVGLVKIVADAKTRSVLGGHIAGPHAGEMVHEIAMAIYLHASIDDLANMIHAYPTYSEAVTAAATMAIS